ncbi:ExeA family protein [candidate division CSSED10-310 bacterium]|uniref:ExeA family protein n=1 Tax=candidate division CSSED10-310 bacterium TaxID=2855610 RepID=A0ABV6Z057_UNCC1
MADTSLQSLYGLTFHPFQPDIPAHALWEPSNVGHFIARVEKLVGYGGFALLSGETGLGKSKIIQMIAERFRHRDGFIVGIMERPQSTITDFYRELGDVFDLNLAPANRYGSFRSLRLKWKSHLDQRLLRPLLLIDEAQEMPVTCLTELRLLSSEQFDSHNLLTVVLSGDARLPDLFREPALVPLGSRIRVRLVLRSYHRNELLAFLNHQLSVAGSPTLMTDDLKNVLVDHAGGNIRVLTNMATDLLEEGVSRNVSQLDEKLYIDRFTPHRSPGTRTSSKSKRP